jgi:hypothetical protein
MLLNEIRMFVDKIDNMLPFAVRGKFIIDRSYILVIIQINEGNRYTSSCNVVMG